jgi:Ca2+-binding EF-hand superfamily protein
LSFAEFLPLYTRHRHLLPWMSLIDIIVEPAAAGSVGLAGAFAGRPQSAAAAPAPSPAPAPVAASELKSYRPPVAVADRKAEARPLLGGRSGAAAARDVSAGAGADVKYAKGSGAGAGAGAPVDESDEVVATVRLTDDGDSLELKARDVVSLRWIRDQFRALTPQRLAQAFAEHAPEGALTRSAFARCMLSVLPSLAPPHTGMLAYQLSNIFDMFDSDGDDLVSQTELFAGVYVLTRGHPRDKLGIVFHGFDRNNDGFIQEHELRKFFASYLSTVLGLSSCTRGVPTDAIRAVIAKASAEAADKLMHAADRNHDG